MVMGILLTADIIKILCWVIHVAVNVMSLRVVFHVARKFLDVAFLFLLQFFSQATCCCRA
jgi:hypothetical protein